jgi:hypothetical protein
MLRTRENRSMMIDDLWHCSADALFFKFAQRGLILGKFE